MSGSTSSLGRGMELVWGAEEVAKIIGRTPRQTFHLMASGQIPAKKIGGRWCAERGKLIEFFTKEDAA